MESKATGGVKVLSTGKVERIGIPLDPKAPGPKGSKGSKGKRKR